MTIQRLKIINVGNEIGLEKTMTFRPYGKQAKTIILNRINELLPNDCLDMDFSGIEICDVSFVDEIIVEVQLFLRNNKENLFYVSNINEATLENLEAALFYREKKNNERVPILVNREGELVVVGTLEPNLHETFKQLAKTKEITARDIAELNDIAINSASNRLKKLFDLRLVLRQERITLNGKDHIYQVPI